MILDALAEALANEQPCALITLVAAIGSSPRPIGSQMLIDADNRRFGVISSGCIEAAIAEQAHEAMHVGQGRLLRYGKGSPWVDLQLPCGAGIDVHVAVTHDALLIEQTRQRLAQRQVVNWKLRPQISQWVDADTTAMADAQQIQFLPQRQLLIAGKGAALTSLAAIASQCEIAVHCISPEQTDLDAAHPYCRSTQLINHANDFKAPALDRWSGAVLLFHDHDWEPQLLSKLLQTDAAYLAALGSPQSHHLRCELLAELGITDQQIARLKGPAGLNIGAKSPAEIALSIVAEFVEKLSLEQAG